MTIQRNAPDRPTLGGLVAESTRQFTEADFAMPLWLLGRLVASCLFWAEALERRLTGDAKHGTNVRPRRSVIKGHVYCSLKGLASRFECREALATISSRRAVSSVVIISVARTSVAAGVS